VERRLRRVADGGGRPVRPRRSRRGGARVPGARRRRAGAVPPAPPSARSRAAASRVERPQCPSAGDRCGADLRRARGRDRPRRGRPQRNGVGWLRRWAITTGFRGTRPTWAWPRRLRSANGWRSCSGTGSPCRWCWSWTGPVRPGCSSGRARPGPSSGASSSRVEW